MERWWRCGEGGGGGGGGVRRRGLLGLRGTINRGILFQEAYEMWRKRQTIKLLSSSAARYYAPSTHVLQRGNLLPYWVKQRHRKFIHVWHSHIESAAPICEIVVYQVHHVLKAG